MSKTTIALVIGIILGIVSVKAIDILISPAYAKKMGQWDQFCETASGNSYINQEIKRYSAEGWKLQSIAVNAKIPSSNIFCFIKPKN